MTDNKYKTKEYDSILQKHINKREGQSETNGQEKQIENQPIISH